MSQPPFEQSQALAAQPGIRHGFFGRKSGINDRELNTSETIGDDPTQTAQNRLAALAAIGAKDVPLASLRQTHSTDVLVLSEIPPEHDRPEADGLVTNLPGLALGILTADCTPVLLCDPAAGIVGACHAGWKGAVGGIAANTVAAMQTLGARPENIIAAIGPSISGANYEVGPEFAAQVTAANPATAPFILKPTESTREHFDVPGFVAASLRDLGIQTIERVGGCTLADPERYFSHRHTTKHGSNAGRQISLIAIH